MRRPLFEKNEAYRRTVHDLERERDEGHAAVIDLQNHRKVDIWWDQNEQMKEDGVFRIRIGKEEACLDVEQVMKSLRWV